MNAAVLQALEAAQPYVTGLRLILGGESTVALVPLGVFTLFLLGLGTMSLTRRAPVSSQRDGVSLALGNDLKDRLSLVHAALNVTVKEQVLPQEEEPVPVLGPEFFERLAQSLGAVQESVVEHEVLDLDGIMRAGEATLSHVQQSGGSASMLLVELDGWARLSRLLNDQYHDDALGCLTRSAKKYLEADDCLGFISDGRLLVMLGGDDGARAERYIHRLSDDLARHSLPMGAASIKLGANAVYAVLYPELGEFKLIKEALVEALQEDTVQASLSLAG